MFDGPEKLWKNVSKIENSPAGINPSLGLSDKRQLGLLS